MSLLVLITAKLTSTYLCYNWMMQMVRVMMKSKSHLLLVDDIALKIMKTDTGSSAAGFEEKVIGETNNQSGVKQEHTLSGKGEKQKTMALQTPVQTGSFKPVTLPKPSAKKLKFSEFSSVAKAEEATCQKEIELAKIKFESAARIRMEAEKIAFQAKMALETQCKEEHSEKR